MAMTMPTIYVYDRWGEQLRTLQGIISAKRSCTVNGEHTFKVETREELEKGQRLVFHDTNGRLREFIVSEPKESRDSKGRIFEVTCEDSIAELCGDYLVEVEPTGTASVCLTCALSESRWTIGTVDVSGSKHCSFYHSSAREAVNDVAEAFSAEISTTIEASGATITSRKVNLSARIGADNGKRFTYRKDLQGIERTVESGNVITGLYGYGKGLACYDANGNATGGFSRKLTFGAINGGHDYVTDEDAKQHWGRPDGNGGIAHVWDKVEFSDCEDAHELLALTKKELQARSQPQVSYTATVVDLKAAGFSTEGVAEGDTVYIIDTSYEPELRLSGRVLKIVEDLCAPEKTKLTLGNIAPAITNTLINQAQSVGKVTDHAGAWDSAASVNSNYINGLVNRLNEEFDAGASYKYEGFEIGTIYSSVPLDENFKPTRTPASAIQLIGGGFRIANSVKANGEFNWRTFGDGNGFTADYINAGVIQGGSNWWNLETGELLFKQGVITDAKGKNSWDLTNGVLTTEQMVANDASVNGTISSQGANRDVYIKDGQIDFYSPDSEFDPDTYAGHIGGTQWATIAADSTGLRLVGTGTGGFGTGDIDLSCGALYVRTNGARYTGRTETIYFIAQDRNSQTNLFGLRFVNGLFVGGAL